MNKGKKYRHYWKILRKLEKKIFSDKTICYHFTNEDAYNNIKESGVFKINRKENVKDEKDVEYSYKVLRECINLCEKAEDKDGEFGYWLYEHSPYDLYCFSTTYDKNNSYAISEYGSYCIKVNTKKMFAKLKNTSGIYCVKMGYTEYNPVRQKQKITKLLNLYYAICELGIDSDLAKECKEDILFFLDLIKCSKCSKEKELRILFNFNDISELKIKSDDMQDQEKYEETHIDKYCKFLRKVD